MVALEVLEEDPETILLIFPSNRIVDVNTDFSNAIEKSVRFAKQNKIILFGIRPDSPNIGFGYIRAGERIQQNVYAVDGFIEKPSIETAKKLILDKSI